MHFCLLTLGRRRLYFTSPASPPKHILTVSPCFLSLPNAYTTQDKITAPETTLFPNFQIPLQTPQISSPALPRHVLPRLPKAAHRTASQNMGLRMSRAPHGRVIMEFQSSMRRIQNPTSSLTLGMSRVTPKLHQGV